MAVLDHKWNIWPWDNDDLAPNNVKVSVNFSLDVDHGSGLGEVRHHPAGHGSCQEPLLQLSCRLPWMGGHVDIHSVTEHDSDFPFHISKSFWGRQMKRKHHASSWLTETGVALFFFKLTCLWKFEARGYRIFSHRKNLLLEWLPQTPKSPQMILHHPPAQRTFATSPH